MKRILLCGLLAVTLLFALSQDANAQNRGVSYIGDNLWMVTYSVGVPMGDTKDYIGRTSWLGFTIEGRQFVKPSLTVGITAGWQTFDEKAYHVDTFGATTVAGTQFRYENIFPALATAHYYFGSPDAAKYYIGTGVGTYWIERRTEFGLWAATDSNWHFGLAPEIGVVLPSGSTSWVLLARYNYALKSGDMEAQEWLTIQIGIQYN